MKKVRNAYVKCMMGCADIPGCRGPTLCAVLEPTRLPRNSSIDSDRDANALRLPLRANAYSDTRKGLRRRMDGQSGARESTRSYSLGIGVMGRIDEDKPCCFEEYYDDVRLVNKCYSEKQPLNSILEGLKANLQVKPS